MFGNFFSSESESHPKNSFSEFIQENCIQYCLYFYLCIIDHKLILFYFLFFSLVVVLSDKGVMMVVKVSW